MSEPEPMGRRERKKAATRKAISDVATRMFIERGFDAVSIREIAEAADVSPTTVFAHFPQKEALVFDEAAEQRAQLVAAIRDRPTGTTISAALKAYLQADFDETLRHAGEHPLQAIDLFMQLVRGTPALAEYEARMWLQHEGVLADTIAEALGLAGADGEIRAYARFVLQVWQLMNSSTDPLAMLDASFRILDGGWAAYEAAASR